MKDKLRNLLLELQDKEYRNFHSKLCTTKYNILGVNLPTMRKIAKRLSKEDLKLFLNNCYNDYYEEIMIQGLAIAYSKYPKEDILQLIDNYIYKIDNWAICDSFCNTLKIIGKNREFFYLYILRCLESNEEFIIRFGIVILMNYYINDKYFNDIVEKIIKIDSKYYYVQMAQAWFLAEAYLSYPVIVTRLLENKVLSLFVHNKSIQKMVESYRISKEDKEYLKSLKQK